MCRWYVGGMQVMYICDVYLTCRRHVGDKCMWCVYLICMLHVGDVCMWCVYLICRLHVGDVCMWCDCYVFMMYVGDVCLCVCLCVYVWVYAGYMGVCVYVICASENQRSFKATIRCQTFVTIRTIHKVPLLRYEITYCIQYNGSDVKRYC